MAGQGFIHRPKGCHRPQGWMNRAGCAGHEGSTESPVYTWGWWKAGGNQPRPHLSEQVGHS